MKSSAAHFSILIFFLYLLAFAGCTPGPEYDFDQNTKDYVYYAPGSYWIYRDSADHTKKDSVIIKSNTYSIIGVGAEKPSKVEVLRTIYYSSKDSIYVIDGQYDTYGDKDFSGNKDGNLDPDYGYKDTSSTINYYYVEPYNGIGDFTPGPDTMRVQNKLYKDIQQFRMPELNRAVVWSKHIGVIKSTTRGRTWELDTCVVKQ